MSDEQDFHSRILSQPVRFSKPWKNGLENFQALEKTLRVKADSSERLVGSRGSVIIQL
ncbi:MAG: hypothetical protein NTY53_11335 [Kiritimatiellaeota bacterium]|nr:hypothetical protein [Kiritimatiellota bacterium]